MDKPLDRHKHYHRERENPSFSSTLLDAIYRSIDESNGKGDGEDMIFCRETLRKKNINGFKEEDKASSLQKACMIEKWMEEKISYEKVSVRRKSMADFDKKTPVLLNSSSSSSESSSGGAFSSSESESLHGLSSISSSTYISQKPKPIRTSVSAHRPERSYQTPADQFGYQKAKHEAGTFVKTKSKAMKIYGDLKKVKQPISPGGRLASFLNSLFTAGNAKKAKISSERELKSEQTSTCSSASSFSRSCLSKTPSSRGKLSSGTKRSVRFYPVSVIVDEESRPCGHKNLHENREETALKSIHEELKFRVMKESRRVEEVARDLLKNYQKRQQEELHARDLCNANNNNRGEFSEEEEEEDDDGQSYASSDLFELDNLSAIGIERYCEELPVYETTHLGTNLAIANGLIL